MNSEFKQGQDVMNPETTSGSAMAGFNRRVGGYTYNESFTYQNERVDSSLHAGWDLACKLIDKGEIFYVNNFHDLECKGGHAFIYGASFVCNTCGGYNLAKEWWKIRVFMDGNAWICIGLGFDNLQESDNYAFGDSKEEAIKNYGELCIKEGNQHLEEPKKSD